MTPHRDPSNVDTSSSRPAGSAKAGVLYERLKADVLSGVLRPGQRLSEASLSREYGMSRSPIREATIRLENEGLFERFGLVVRVRPRTFEEIIDIYRVRVFLEGAIAADAADRRRAADVVRLQVSWDAESAVGSEDLAAAVRANQAFHASLAVAAHNVTLRDLQDRLTAQVATMPRTTLSHPGRWAEAHDEHAAIVAAVRDGNTNRARSLGEQHMSRARDIQLASFTDHLGDH